MRIVSRTRTFPVGIRAPWKCRRPSASSAEPPAAETRGDGLAFFEKYGARTAGQKKSIQRLAGVQNQLWDPEKMTRKFEQLQVLGLDVKSVVSRAPELLVGYDLQPDGVLDRKIQKLRAGLPETLDVNKLILKAPALLLLDAQKLLGKVETLKAALAKSASQTPADVAVAKLIQGAPLILKLDVESNIKQKIEMLEHFLPSFDITKMIVRAPLILTMDVSKVPGKLRDLEELVPGIDARRAVASHPSLLRRDIKGGLTENVAKLKAILPHADMAELLLRGHILLQYSVERTLKPRIFFMRAALDLNLGPTRVESYEFEVALAATLVKRPLLLNRGWAPLGRIEFLRCCHTNQKGQVDLTALGLQLDRKTMLEDGEKRRVAPKIAYRVTVEALPKFLKLVCVDIHHYIKFLETELRHREAKGRPEAPLAMKTHDPLVTAKDLESRFGNVLRTEWEAKVMASTQCELQPRHLPHGSREAGENPLY